MQKDYHKRNWGAKKGIVLFVKTPIHVNRHRLINMLPVIIKMPYILYLQYVKIVEKLF